MSTYRTLFLSDVHLGAAGSRARELSLLLRRMDCGKLYLVGDILDLIAMRRRWRWPAEHQRLVLQILEVARRGTEVVFIPGNHDAAARQFAGCELGGVRVELRDVHTTADGRRVLVTHGDQFDKSGRHSWLLRGVGTAGYSLLLAISGLNDVLRRMLRLPRWSLSHYVKSRLASACRYVESFESSLVEEAAREGFDGVVCGHIHKAEHREGSIGYYNCGDWIESCTALAERHDGRLELIDGMAAVAEEEQVSANSAKALELPVFQSAAANQQ